MSNPDKQRWRFEKAGDYLLVQWLESGTIEAFHTANWHAARTILSCSSNELAEALMTVDPKLWLYRQPPIAKWTQDDLFTEAQ